MQHQMKILVWLKKQHRNVTANVKASFNYNEEFHEFSGDGYAILSALHFMGISEFNDIPVEFPGDVQSKTFYLNNIAPKIIDLIFISMVPLVNRIISEDQDVEEIEYQYCVCRTDIGDPMIFCEN